MNNKQPVKILFCEGNTDGTVGGSFFSLLYLVSGLDKDKYQPIVVFHNEHSLLPQYHAAGIETLIIPAYAPVVFLQPDAVGLGKLLAPVLRIAQKLVNFAGGLFGRAFYYARLLRRLNIELVHLNNSIIRNNDWMLGSLFLGIPCITHERGINAAYPWLSRFLARRLKAVICISNAVRDNLCRYGVDAANLVTIYNGIDPDVVQPDCDPEAIMQQQNITPNDRVIGVIGNIKEWKGQEVMVQAMPLILQQVPNLVCLLVGDTAQADRYYYERLSALCKKLAVEQQLRFTGYTANVANYMQVMEIVVHTSVEPEPFGRVLIEAMAMHKPVVGSRDGAVTEIVAEAETGLTFPPGDAKQLAEAVLSLLLVPERAQSMGQAGRIRLEAEFDIRANVRKTEALYASILGN